jgi:hypothetical protein
VPEADVQPAKHLAECKRCKDFFTLDVPAVKERPPVPAGVRVVDDGMTRTLSFRWFSWRTPLWVLFCIVWDAFLIFWYWKALGGPRADWFAVLFSIGHVAVGVMTKYRTLCELVNRTVVEVGDVLRVRHGPIPWRGVEISAPDVVAVETVPVLHRGKGQSAWVRFTVQATTESGPTVTLFTGLESLPRAQFFEWQIEDWLDLLPTPVPGEAA